MDDENAVETDVIQEADARLRVELYEFSTSGRVHVIQALPYTVYTECCNALHDWMAT